jgi:hypothetical protein
MCSAPVTLGGGMTMVKGGLSDSMSGLKKPHFSHLQCNIHVLCWALGQANDTAPASAQLAGACCSTCGVRPCNR